MEDFAPANNGNTTGPQVSTSGFGNPPQDNEGITQEASQLQDLLSQDAIDLSEADTDEAFARAEAILAAHRMRFRRIQLGRKAALDALAAQGLTIHDVGWTEVEKAAAPAPRRAQRQDDEYEQPAPRRSPARKKSSGQERVVQVLKNSSPKLFYSTGRVPKIGCHKDGTKDESKWRIASDAEVAEYERQQASKRKR